MSLNRLLKLISLVLSLQLAALPLQVYAVSWFMQCESTEQVDPAVMPCHETAVDTVASVPSSPSGDCPCCNGGCDQACGMVHSISSLNDGAIGQARLPHENFSFFDYPRPPRLALAVLPKPPRS